MHLELYIFVEVKDNFKLIINKIGCGKEQEIKPNEPVLCTECSGRIFYKKRGNKASQYEAR
jgi:DNA-directed RNA polymerase I, II, and III subunit RPABC4